MSGTIISQNYDVRSWYWIVADSTTQVFSSAVMAYIDPSDENYVAWTDAGNVATPIDSAESLMSVMAGNWLPLYWIVGVQVESTATPALNGNYPMDQVTQNQISGVANRIAAGRGLPGGGTTFTYMGHNFTEQDFTNFANATADWVYATHNALSAIIIDGTGSLPPQPVIIP